MKLLSLFSRNLVQLFVAFGFIFGSLSVHAKVNLKELKEQVSLLNKTRSEKALVSAMTETFTKPGDKKKIASDIRKALKLVKKHKWVWKYELKGREIVLKVNGETQFSFKPVDVDQREFLFNGQKFVLNPSLSYEENKKAMSKILFKKQAGLEQFFINRAYAFGGRPGKNNTDDNLRSSTTGRVYTYSEDVSTTALAAGAIVVSTSQKQAARGCVSTMNLEALSNDGMFKYRKKLLSGFNGGTDERMTRADFQKESHYKKAKSGYNARGRKLSCTYRLFRDRISAMVGNLSHDKNSCGYIENDGRMDRPKYGYSYLPEYNRGKKCGLFEPSCKGACHDKNTCMERCMRAKMNPKWWGMRRDSAARHCNFTWTVYQNCLRCKEPWLNHETGCRNLPCSCNTATGDWIRNDNCVVPEDEDGCKKAEEPIATIPKCECKGSQMVYPGGTPVGTDGCISSATSTVPKPPSEATDGNAPRQQEVEKIIEGNYNVKPKSLFRKIADFFMGASPERKPASGKETTDQGQITEVAGDSGDKCCKVVQCPKNDPSPPVVKPDCHFNKEKKCWEKRDGQCDENNCSKPAGKECPPKKPIPPGDATDGPAVNPDTILNNNNGTPIQ